MAIGTDAAIEFFGTKDSLDDTSGSVADGAFSVASDVLEWTNDDDAPMAAIILEATYASAPDANSSVNLFARPMNIVSTSDSDVPDANFGHVYVGTFPLNDVTSAQFITIDIRLPNTKTSQSYIFYIENNGGQTISAGWDLHIVPKTIGPHA